MPSSPTPRRLHDAATAKAKEIFGDIVDCVWVTTWNHGNSSADEITKRLTDASISCNDELRYDAENIWIRFTNGRVIALLNSEWASIETPEFDDSYEA
jgi:hypothetical protein